MSNKLFRKIHSNNLIYNTCWEDPRCDRQLLNLQSDSRVVMITSAGCNALDYALDAPAQINCIDMNPRQNALLQLKLATYNGAHHSDLFQLFGEGVHNTYKTLYQDGLRGLMPDYARNYWDKNMDYFGGKGIRKTFYHHGTSGLFAWLFSKYLKLRKTNHRLAVQLFDAQDIEEQRSLYFQLEKKVINGFTKWAMSRPIVMYLLGVPDSQHDLFIEDAKGIGFIQKCLRHVFTELPIQENYFWQLYFKGKYDPNCCPNYLKPENFDSLKAKTNILETHTDTLTGFLTKNPAPYSHYVLLDHQDWLAANNRPALEEEWHKILDNSQRGTRILLRSAAYEVDFFPDFVKEAVEFEQEMTQRTHRQDRVGTYGSVYLGIVK